MAHGSDDFIVAAQIFLDRFRLGRRLNDNEFRHGFLSPILYLFKPHSEMCEWKNHILGASENKENAKRTSFRFFKYTLV